LLTACSLSPKDLGKSNMVALNPVNVVLNKNAEVALVVAMPHATAELDTYRIAINKEDGNWDYYAGARWLDFLPLLVQDSIIKSLENSKLVKVVLSDQSSVLGGKVLKLEIREFNTLYKKGNKNPSVKIRIAVNVENRDDRSYFTSFEVKAEKQAKENRISSIQEAFRLAFKSVQKDLIYKLSKKM